MVSVICKVAVVVSVNLGGGGSEVPWQITVALKGKVVSESKNAMVVDFTKDIKTKDLNLIGDYDMVLVDKKECVKMK